MEKRCVFLSYIKGETMWAMGSVLGSLAGVLRGTQGMRLNSGPLEEQAMLLTTEPSLQPP